MGMGMDVVACGNAAYVRCVAALWRALSPPPPGQQRGGMGTSPGGIVGLSINQCANQRGGGLLWRVRVAVPAESIPRAYTYG